MKKTKTFAVINGYSLLERFKRYIEEEPWDEDLDRFFKTLESFIWIFIAFAIGYVIVPSIYKIIVR